MGIPRIQVAQRSPSNFKTPDETFKNPGPQNLRGRPTERRSRRAINEIARLERDQARGYSINVKQVVLAFAVEFWIIALIVVGTYLLIADNASDHVSSTQLFSALLLPAALAMVELARVPLALAVRTQEAWHIKFFAAIGVVAAITITAFSLSQIAWKTFDIRIAEATRAGDRLAEAKKNRENVQSKLDQATLELEEKISARNGINKRLADLEAQLTKVHAATGQSCKPVMGPDNRPMMDANGKPHQTCSVVSTVNPTQMNALKAQIASIKKEQDAAQASVSEAEHNKQKIDLRPAEREVSEAEAAYRAAVNKSQLHSYTSMVTGKPVAEVTEAEVKSLEKWLILIPSIAAAFASTLIAITAVRRIKRKEDPPTTIPDEAAAYLFGPLIEAIKSEANSAVANAVNGRTKASARQKEEPSLVASP